MKLFFIKIMSLLMLLSCSKDEKPTAEIDKLPPATQNGANTAGCLVDGKAFTPKGFVQGGNLVLNYFGDSFTFGIGQKSKNKPLKSIGIFLDQLPEPLIVNQVYVLNSKFLGIPGKAGIYSIDSPSPPNINFYETNESVTGELIITHHDFDNAILSGTFWFDAVNSEGDIVEVREGRFDVKY